MTRAEKIAELQMLTHSNSSDLECLKSLVIKKYSEIKAIEKENEVLQSDIQVMSLDDLFGGLGDET